MELIEIENLDLESNELTVVFDGLFPEGFFVKSEFSYDNELIEEKDEETNCKDVIALLILSFGGLRLLIVKKTKSQSTIEN